MDSLFTLYAMRVGQIEDFIKAMREIGASHWSEDTQDAIARSLGITFFTEDEKRYILRSI